MAIEMKTVVLNPGDVDFLREAVDFLIDILDQVDDDED